MLRALRTARWLTVGLVLGLGLLAAPGWAQTSRTGRVWQKSKRLIQRFDFEEARLNNFEDLPMYWYAIGRPALTTDRNFLRQPLHAELVSKPGFPAYTTISFDRPQQEPGEHRLHLGLNGGSAGAFVEIGTLPAVPHSDYLVTSTVLTSRLEHARARLKAYFVDEKGRQIEPSVASSELIKTDGRNQILYVHLYGDYPQAAWIGLQVELLQSKDQPGAPLERHDVQYEDVKGSAWFDNISVWQLPYVEVKTQNPVNIVRAPDRPRLGIQVRDLTARPLDIDIRLYDHHRNMVAHSTRHIDEWAPMNWQWEPSLKRFGWYLVDMLVYEPAESGKRAEPVMIARSITSLLWLPNEDAMNPTDATRFRVIAERATEKEFNLLPQLLDNARVDSLVVSAWDADTTPSNLDNLQRRIGELTQAVVGRGREIIVSFSPVPDEVAQGHDIDPRDPLTLFTKSRDLWVPLISPVLMLHGQRIRDWQLGTTDYPVAFFRDDLPELTRSLYYKFRNMAPQPRLVLPWRLEQSRRALPPPEPAYQVDVPVAVTPSQIGRYTKQWLHDPPAEFWLHLREPPATEMDHDRRVDDMALRMLYTWEAQPTGIAMTRPWAYPARRRISLLPDPLLGIFSSLAHRLAGRRVIGWLPLNEGLRCMILDGPAGGALAAWNLSAPPDEAGLEFFLGSNPEEVDVWGNRRAVEMSGSKHKVSLGTTPIFLEGIDPDLAMFRASFKIIPPFIESLVSEHQRVIRFTNPWPYTISGHMNITQPEGWDIQPKRHHFSIASGQSATVPVVVQFPVTEEVGPKRLVAHFDFTAKERYTVDVSAPMEIGLSNVDFDATVAIDHDPETGQRDVVVTQMITNRGTEPMALYAFANMVGYPRQERIIAQLMPGQLVVRRFRFPAAADKLLDKQSIRVGVRETTGPAMLNMILSGTDL